MRFTGKTILMSLLLLAIYPAIASASLIGVSAYDNTSLGRNAYGTKGRNYVMQVPMSLPFSDSQHVSSFYIWQDSPYGYNYAEVGWYAANWAPSWGSPYFFAAWQKNGVYTISDIRAAVPGTYHNYTVRTPYANQGYRFYIDNVWERSATIGIASGFSEASSERNRPGDTNYSHFMLLQKQNSGGTWYNWGSLTQYRDNDDLYFIAKRSNTEFLVQK